VCFINVSVLNLKFKWFIYFVVILFLENLQHFLLECVVYFSMNVLFTVYFLSLWHFILRGLL